MSLNNSSTRQLAIHRQPSDCHRSRLQAGELALWHISPVSAQQPALPAAPAHTLLSARMEWAPVWRLQLACRYPAHQAIVKGTIVATTTCRRPAHAATVAATACRLLAVLTSTRPSVAAASAAVLAASLTTAGRPCCCSQRIGAALRRAVRVVTARGAAPALKV
jgi:hypothetical protein